MRFPEITQDSIGNPAGLQIIQGNLLGLADSLTLVPRLKRGQQRGERQ